MMVHLQVKLTLPWCKTQTTARAFELLASTHLECLNCQTFLAHLLVHVKSGRIAANQVSTFPFPHPPNGTA
jgi:hypothetical protein